MSPEASYSIREASELTGVQPVTLRAWERRYGLLRPSRTERGHRVYGTADLRRINDIVFWVDQGVAISRVAGLLAGERVPAAGDSEQDDEALERSLTALAQGNVRRLEKVLSGQLALYPLEKVIDDYIEPVRRHLRGQAAEPLSRARLALFETLVQQKLSVRLFNLAPGRKQYGIWLAPLGRPGGLDLVLLALAVGQRLPVTCCLQELDVDAVLAQAGASHARAVLFQLAPGLSGTRLRRLLGHRAARLERPVYACGESGLSVPPGVALLSGGPVPVARALVQAQGEGQ